MALALAQAAVPGARANGDERDGARAEPLFRIDRSKNDNVVQYDARLRADGSIDPEEPVVAYWIKLEKDGRRKELTWVQRRFAYGFDTDWKDGVLEMEMVAPIGRVVRVYAHEGRYRAETRIDGRPAFIESLFIQSIERRFGRPKVEYIDFLGEDLETGESLRERYVPD